MDSVNAMDRSGHKRAAPVTYVCGQPGAPGDLSRTLMRTLGQVALTKSLQEIKDHPPGAFAVIHYDTLTAGERRELMDGTSSHPRRPTLLLSGSLSPDELKDLFSSGALTNVLALSGSAVDVSDLLVTAQKFLRGDIFGLEKYFGWGVEPLGWRVRGSDGKRPALEAIVEYAASRGVARRLSAGLRVVADEFLTNALYNAPVDSGGARRFAHWPRTRPVQLASNEWIDVRYCCDGRRFGLSVADPFGSLASARLQDNLARAFRRGEDQVREGDGGAGLGFYQILDSLSHLIVNIDPGVRTEMIGLLDVSGGYRAFASAAKSFNIFEKEGAR